MDLSSFQLSRRLDAWAEVMRRARHAGFGGSQKTLDDLRREAALEAEREAMAFEEMCTRGIAVDRFEHYEARMPAHLKPYMEAVFYRPGESVPISTNADVPIEDWIHGKI